MEKVKTAVSSMKKKKSVGSSMKQKKNVAASRAAAKPKATKEDMDLVSAEPAVEHYRENFEIDIEEVAQSYQKLLTERPRGISHLSTHERVLMALGHECIQKMAGKDNAFTLPHGLMYMQKLLPQSMSKEWQDILDQSQIMARTFFERMRFLIKKNEDFKSFKMGIDDYSYMALGSECLGRSRKKVGQTVPIFPLKSLVGLDPSVIEKCRQQLKKEKSGPTGEELQVKAIEMAKGETLTLS